MGVDLSGSCPDMDVAEHERTYNGFLSLVKYGTGVTLLSLILLYFFVV